MADVYMQDLVAELRERAQEWPNSVAASMALGLIADMEFTLSDNWPKGFPNASSRVTPRECHTFDSATVCVEALLKLASLEWQPIETAPKGRQEPYSCGPRVILGNPKVHGAFTGHWEWYKNAKTGAWRDGGRLVHWIPTHWMPFPEIPDEET